MGEEPQLCWTLNSLPAFDLLIHSSLSQVFTEHLLCTRAVGWRGEQGHSLSALDELCLEWGGCVWWALQSCRAGDNRGRIHQPRLMGGGGE